METFKDFLTRKGVSEDDFKTKSPEEMAKLYSEYNQALFKEINENKADKKDLPNMEEELKGLAKNKDLETIKKAMKEQGDVLAKLETAGGGVPKVNGVRKELNAKKESIEKMVSAKNGNVEMTVKATHDSVDVGDRDFYAEEESGTTRKPFRSFKISQLFNRRPLTKEFLKYREEDTVTRDGNVVVRCATATDNTKKTWALRTVEVAKIRVLTDICEDMMDDYDFVEGEINELVTQTANAKEETELLTGAGDGLAGTYLSIDTISSEFNHANALAPYTESFQAPTLAELTDSMRAQITTFGQENMWNPNVILMNYNDKVKFKHEKNADGDYLLPHFISTNGDVLNDMIIVTSPLVAPNELYVMDTTQAVILDRKTTEVSMFFENKDNAEHEMVTVKALKRSQFHVKQINRDAFMKCSDIEAALEAIAKP